MHFCIITKWSRHLKKNPIWIPASHAMIQWNVPVHCMAVMRPVIDIKIEDWQIEIDCFSDRFRWFGSFDACVVFLSTVWHGNIFHASESSTKNVLSFKLARRRISLKWCDWTARSLCFMERGDKLALCGFRLPAWRCHIYCQRRDRMHCQNKPIAHLFSFFFCCWLFCAFPKRYVWARERNRCYLA